MHDFPLITLAFITGYLLGSFPSAYVLVRLTLHHDITRMGSGNVGALNVLRATGSKVMALIVLGLDALKGAGAVLVWKAGVGGDLHQTLVAAAGAVLGHIFPVWLKFKGGRGLATSAGVFLALYPLAVLVWLALWGIIFLVSRKVIFGNTFAIILTPVAVLLIKIRDIDPLLYGFLVGICLIVFVRHVPRLKQSLQKSPSKLMYE